MHLAGIVYVWGEGIFRYVFTKWPSVPEHCVLWHGRVGDIAAMWLTISVVAIVVFLVFGFGVWRDRDRVGSIPVDARAPLPDLHNHDGGPATARGVLLPRAGLAWRAQQPPPTCPAPAQYRRLGVSGDQRRLGLTGATRRTDTRLPCRSEPAR